MTPEIAIIQNRLYGLRGYFITGAVCLVVGLLAGIAIGWKLYHPTQVIETAKPAIVLDKGVVALERKPDQPPPPELKKAARQLKGTLERTATVKLQPKPKVNAPEGCSCEEITVDVGTIDEGDGKRTVVHADNATIVGGTDNPLVPYTASREQNWEVGAVVPLEYPEGVGAYVSRKLGPFSVGLQAAQPSAQEGWTAMATVGIRF